MIRWSALPSRTIMTSQKGVSALEGMIAIAILSIVAFSLMSWTNMSYQGMSSLNGNNEISKAMSRLVGALGESEVYCSHMLANRIPGTPIDVIYYYDSASETLLLDKPVLKQGQNLEPNRDSVLVKSILLKSQFDMLSFYDPIRNPAPAAGVIVADLEVTFQKKSNLGPDEIIRRIPLFVTLEAGKVKTCSPSAQGVLHVNQMICRILSDGFSYFNPDSASPRHCVELDAVQWKAGADPFSAKCPAGMKPAVTLDHTITGPATVVCRINSSSTVPGPPRTYNSGYVSADDFQAGRGTYNSATQTCEFKFPSGADPSNLSSEIKCIDSSF